MPVSASSKHLPPSTHQPSRFAIEQRQALAGGAITCEHPTKPPRSRRSGRKCSLQFANFGDHEELPFLGSPDWSVNETSQKLERKTPPRIITL